MEMLYKIEDNFKSIFAYMHFKIKNKKKLCRSKILYKII